MKTEFARDVRNRLLAPLSIAAYITWGAIAVGSVDPDALASGNVAEWLGLGALVAMIALFVLCAAQRIDPSRQRPLMIIAVIIQGVLVLTALALLGGGAVPILLIIVSAQLFTMLPVGWAVAVLVVLNLGMLAYWVSRGYSVGALILQFVPMLGFQAFAALTAMYAERSERGREALADLNAELLATQRLLEEATRSEERLRLSRELHDVSGHKLTAMKLNLRAMQRDPALAAREDVALCLQLADELLGDIRGVVGELRHHEGIDLGAALAALAHPLRGIALELRGAEHARVNSVAAAEGLLRVAQEALTNALRHGQSTRVVIDVQRDDAGLRLAIEDNGRGRLPVVEGNGLSGMRERLAAFAGTLDIEQAAPQGLRLIVRLPATASPSLPSASELDPATPAGTRSIA